MEPIISNAFTRFEFFLSNLELELSKTKNKGRILEGSLDELIYHYRQMEKQNIQDFQSIKPKHLNNELLLTACRTIIEFVLINIQVTDDLVELELMYSEEDRLKLKVLKYI